MSQSPSSIPSLSLPRHSSPRHSCPSVLPPRPSTLPQKPPATSTGPAPLPSPPSPQAPHFLLPVPSSLSPPRGPPQVSLMPSRNEPAHRNIAGPALSAFDGQRSDEFTPVLSGAELSSCTDSRPMKKEIDSVSPAPLSTEALVDETRLQDQCRSHKNIASAPFAPQDGNEEEENEAGPSDTHVPSIATQHATFSASHTILSASAQLEPPGVSSSSLDSTDRPLLVGASSSYMATQSGSLFPSGAILLNADDARPNAQQSGSVADGPSTTDRHKGGREGDGVRGEDDGEHGNEQSQGTDAQGALEVLTSALSARSAASPPPDEHRDVPAEFREWQIANVVLERVTVGEKSTYRLQGECEELLSTFDKHTQAGAPLEIEPGSVTLVIHPQQGQITRRKQRRATRRQSAKPAPMSPGKTNRSRRRKKMVCRRRWTRKEDEVVQAMRILPSCWAQTHHDLPGRSRGAIAQRYYKLKGGAVGGESSDEYEVEALLDKRGEVEIEYLVQWENFSEEHNSWVSQDDISTTLVIDFERKNAQDGENLSGFELLEVRYLSGEAQCLVKCRGRPNEDSVWVGRSEVNDRQMEEFEAKADI